MNEQMASVYCEEEHGMALSLHIFGRGSACYGRNITSGRFPMKKYDPQTEKDSPYNFRSFAHEKDRQTNNILHFCNVNRKSTIFQNIMSQGCSLAFSTT